MIPHHRGELLDLTLMALYLPKPWRKNCAFLPFQHLSWASYTLLSPLLLMSCFACNLTRKALLFRHSHKLVRIPSSVADVRVQQAQISIASAEPINNRSSSLGRDHPFCKLSKVISAGALFQLGVPFSPGTYQTPQYRRTGQTLLFFRSTMRLLVGGDHIHHYRILLLPLYELPYRCGCQNRFMPTDRPPVKSSSHRTIDGGGSLGDGHKNFSLLESLHALLV